jgi:hypothetical protein
MFVRNEMRRDVVAQAGKAMDSPRARRLMSAL